MYSTVENTHSRILEKLAILRNAAEEASAFENTACIVQLIDEVEACYCLAVASVLGQQYSGSRKLVREYYRIVAAENICGRMNELTWLLDDVRMKIESRRDKKSKAKLGKIVSMLKIDCDAANKIVIRDYIEKCEETTCKCGAEYEKLSESAELRCSDCMKTIPIIGGTMKEEQYSNKEKAKNTGHEVVRHLKFWLDRIQAIEPKSFEPEVIANIKYVMKRDGYIKTELSCELMRSILKDPQVSATYLNDHVPLLIKTLGGDPPPVLTYTEVQAIQLRFIRAMNIYEQLNPGGGNKPYYPHFIYKIIEEMFKGDLKKLRILNYIHLQSSETVSKNDSTYRAICQIANDPQSGLVYRDTNIFKKY
jgi:hypothetical protein